MDTRAWIFVRPVATSTSFDWETIKKNLGNEGVQVMEDCSGAPLGQEHNDLIISATIKDYGRVPQLIQTFYQKLGLSVTVYPYATPQHFTQLLSGQVAQPSGATPNSGR